MSQNIYCTVDTGPMADEIADVSRHVEGTTAAVVTMHSAVIAAEAAGAEKICKNVNRGFFTMMASQISQKIASKKSRVEALLMMLNQQQRKLTGVKTTMEREYGRIAARYLRIFSSINKEMEQRVKQVDLPVFELVNKNMATLSNRMNSNSTCFPLLQNEDIALSQSLLVSKMKGNAKEALDKTTDFLMQLRQQRQLTEKVLLDVRGVNDTKILLVPVLLLTTVADESGSIQNGMILPYDIDGRIADKIRNNVKEDDLGWKENDVDVHVAEAFTAILAKKKLPQRVEKLMKIMFANAKFETLQS